ncbi:DUF2268 domain-containing putative Zn-dependent protease [Gracilibacillus sp. YIM 98692]|uniref:DUF2268 domain-containing protein n=1 Tax=Gracilibacillus sp. YIM 98692 TaxID=2663532 RepID=UPI0013D3AFEE|nr:DUF2268 domain-containing putative Zn-dependent protease [Gracilibacillus sp. YIM 98692]
MGLKPTNQWLKAYTQLEATSNAEAFRKQQNKICEPLMGFFQNAEADIIQDYLIQNGLFVPVKNDPPYIQAWLKKRFLTITEKLYQKFRQKWNGPDIPIFVLPSNERSLELSKWYGGNAGLCYPDKLFLFINSNATAKQVAAVFVHEYSHACRLKHFPKEEQEYQLLDAIILEGIAEYAVRKLLGNAYGNQRLEIIPPETFCSYWEDLISPHLSITRNDAIHDHIMYGGRGIPKNLGYLIGYNLIKQFIKRNTYPISKLLYLPNATFLDVINDIRGHE